MIHCNCYHCDGTPGNGCLRCQGRGIWIDKEHDLCPECKGDGTQPVGMESTDPCGECDGKGYVEASARGT